MATKKTAAKPAAKKTAKKTVSKATVAKKAAKAPKAAKTDDKPTLKSILDSADKAFTDMVKRYYALAIAYVQALDYYGSMGRKAFMGRFPLTQNALRNLDLVGRGRLLPQFSLCSNRFTVGLVELNNSLDIQYKLLGAAKGMIRCVDTDGKIVSKSFDELTAKESDIVLSVVAEGEEDLGPIEIADRITKRMAAARAEFKRAKKPAYKIYDGPNGPVVRFFRTVAYSVKDLQKIIEEMK